MVIVVTLNTSLVVASSHLKGTHHTVTKTVGTRASITFVAHGRAFIMGSLTALLASERMCNITSTIATTYFLAYFTVQEDPLSLD